MRRAEPIVLVLPSSVRAQLEAWAAEDYPDEGCGLLVGRTESSEQPGWDAQPAHPGPVAPVAPVRRVVRALRTANVAARGLRQRFEVDPVDHLAAWEGALREGLEVVGCWHSHPDGPAKPSPLDRRAGPAGWSQVILATTARGTLDLCSWRRLGADWIEEQIG